MTPAPGGHGHVDLLHHALEYRLRAWPIIPIAGDKKPPRGFRWRRWQHSIPSEAEIREWNRVYQPTGLAVVLGRGVYCRDFDDQQSYPAWAKEFPDIARRLPTVATGRGIHVYFTAAPTRTIKLSNGELRGDGGYCVLPPSIHPNGKRYEWLITLPAGDLPRIDPTAVGLYPRHADCTERTENTEQQMHTEAVGLGGQQPAKCRSTISSIAAAVSAAAPSAAHGNHGHLFNLARALLSLEAHLARPLSQAEQTNAFDLWYERARAFLRPDQSRTNYYCEFLDAVRRARTPIDSSPVEAAVRRARQALPPQLPRNLNDPEILLLAGICRELQRSAGIEPFYLSSRDAASALGHQTHTTAALWFRSFVQLKILDAVVVGGPETMRATRYRYLYPLDG